MKRSVFSVSFLFIASCLLLVPGTAFAQVTGTAGLSTGMALLGTTLTEYCIVGSSMLCPAVRDVTNVPTVDWGVPGYHASPVLLDCYETIPPGEHCSYFDEHTYPNPGTYTITVTYYEIDGSSHSFQTTANISPIGNFVILSVGDSVASGEGNPDVAARFGLYGHSAYWSENTSSCPDQSLNAGPVLAAQMLQTENPATHITIDHLACSGAKITGGGTTSATAQLQYAVGQLPAGQKIDALLMTVGADSVYANGFGSIVRECLNPNTADQCAPGTTFAGQLASGVNGLDYNALVPYIGGLDISDVYITEYFDPTHDGSGNFPNQAETYFCVGNTVNAEEWPFLYNSLVLPMNEKIEDAALQYGWHYVGGNEFGPEADESSTYSNSNVEPAGEPDFNGPYFPLTSDFTYSGGSGHGYCSGGVFGGVRWVVPLQQSFVIENSGSGTSHPNLLGQQEYATRIVQAINHYTPPETTVAATSNGAPYVFGTWTTNDVDVTLSATNKLASAGVGHTYFSDNDASCTGAALQNCIEYQGPFIMDQSGKRTLYFFSSNRSRTAEKEQSEPVWIDNKPPVMNCTATPAMLWPPNDKLVPVSLNVTAVSAAFGPTPIVLTSVSTSQGNPATDIQGFVIGQPSTRGMLLASRAGNQLAGRTYTFTYRSTDPLGLTGTCTTTVTVPHDQGVR